MKNVPAYTFDPVRFHRLLEENIMVGGDLRANLLLAMAKSLVVKASPTMLRALDILRFDEERWFDTTDDPECSYASQCYVVVLASVLEDAPPVSNASMGVLLRVLPILGWSEERVEVLCRGQPLSQLVHSSQNHLFYFVFGPGQHGSWLSPESVKSFLDDIQAVESNFRNPSEEMLRSVSEHVVPWTLPRQQPQALITDAYAEICRRLETASGRKHALFMPYE
ncbi:MAG TPA: hypothetical protein VL486_06005 [Verrucomicrobiae bacterium]|nr:hypothetical protein [Verrucomicrobiae bacterium]